MALSVTVSSLDYWGRTPKRRGDRGARPHGLGEANSGLAASGTPRSRDPLSRWPVVLSAYEATLIPNTLSLRFLRGHRHYILRDGFMPSAFPHIYAICQ